MADVAAPVKPAAALVDLYGKKDVNGKALADNCSGFVKETMKHFRISFADGNADAVIDQIANDTSTWTYLGKGAEGGPTAADAAGKGYLVLAVLKAADHLQFAQDKKTGEWNIPNHRNNGHVSVVLPKTDKNGYPYLISGSIVDAGKSDGSKSVRGVWRGVDAVNVEYYRSNVVYPELVPVSFGK